MAKLQVMLGILVTGSLLISGAEIPKPGYTRTMLKVARSLPGETEELKVRTSEGSVATLIVKRREKSQDPLPEGNITKSLSRGDSEEAEDRKGEMERSVNKQMEEIREKMATQNLSREDPRPEVSKKEIEDKGDSPRTSRENSSINEQAIDYGNWTPLSKDGRALTTSNGDDDSSWKPLKTSPEMIVDRREDFQTGRNFQEPEMKNYEEDRVSRSRIIDNRSTQYAFLPHQAHRPLTRTNIGANLSKNRGGKNVPPEVTVRSEINVKSLPKRTPMSIDSDGTPIIHGTRVPDEPMDKIQTWRNARVINNKLISENSDAESLNGFYGPDNSPETQRFETFFKDVNRRYGRTFGEDRNVYLEWDPKTNRNSGLNAEIYETRNENYRSNVQKRMLHPDNYQIYPNSQAYTPESQKISPVVLKSGARAPVLQYAHPELGVQPAKVLKNSEKRRPDNFPDNQNSFTEQRHKKKYVLNDKNVVDSYTLKNYYPNQHFYGLKKPNDQPFWVKISENLRNQLSTGVERVSQLTKPVFDPLVEATQKISQNLGLSQGKEAQDKIGTVATGSSILIPALGLVASGAALGIGAVAVGRYLDVDVLKRGRNNRADSKEMEISRALENAETALIYDEDEKKREIVKESVARESEDFLVNPTDFRDRQGGSVKAEKGEVENGETLKRRRRSIEDEKSVEEETMKNSAEQELFRRTGSDSLVEIIEIDVPSNGQIDLPDLLKKYVKENGGGYNYMEDKDASERLMENSLDVEADGSEEEVKSRRRNRRDVDNDFQLDDVFQNLENAEISQAAHIDGDWTNTPCAKRIFCDVMIQRGQDATISMEKKMGAVLRLIQPGAALQVSSHFQEVMEAVRRHDCSSFICPQARPGNVFF